MSILKISTKGRYAIRVMLDIAVNDNGEYISLKSIAERQGVTIKYLEQIMNILTKAGYLRSVRGNSGGYRLSKNPSEYKIGDILRTTEGSLAPTACVEEKESICQRHGFCPTISFWEGLNKTINNYVDSFTLQDLIDDYEKSKGNNFYI